MGYRNKFKESNLPQSTSTHVEQTGTNFGAKHAADVHLMEYRGAFGEIEVIEDLPLVQIDAVYGVRTTDIETFTATGGSVAVKDDHTAKEFDCATGTSSGGYGLIRSIRAGRYRPGQGMKARFTAKFDAGIANCRLAAGLVTSGNELTFGYYSGTASNGTFDGTEFGILRRTGGRLEIQTLTLSASASGNETATITLDGTAYSVSLTSGDEAHNGYEIEIDSDFGSDKAWNAYQNGSTVVFISNSLGDKSGAMTFSSTGTAAGSFAETQAGADATDFFYTQSTWNIDTVNSTANNNFILDPSKGNVYQIQYQYLGYGRIVFGVENPKTGLIKDVHAVTYVNENTNPSMDNPTYKIGWFAASLGSTTDLHVYGASGCINLEGKKRPFRPNSAHGNTKSISTTNLTTVLALRIRTHFKGYVNLSEVFLRNIAIAVELSGNNTAEFEVHLNPTFSSGEPNWTYHDQNESIVEYDTAAGEISSATEILGGGLGRSSDKLIDLNGEGIVLSRGDILAIAVRPTGGTAQATAYATWNEE